ncbi:MAG: hypothetical protein F6K62_27050 [Sphaerospermopsis sp. SIO1G2]|nr:hypothetical protein [Sphaerospermopsis sp. SIO1G2]
MDSSATSAGAAGCAGPQATKNRRINPKDNIKGIRFSLLMDNSIGGGVCGQTAVKKAVRSA